LGGELLVEVRLLRNQAFAERHRFRLHGGMELLRADALLPGQPEPVAELQDMDWARIAVELSQQRQVHASSRAKVGDLLVG
jgi:hypothetical protein